VNGLRARERSARIASSVPDLIAKCKEVEPSIGVIICKGPVFTAVAKPLREAGVKVLHDNALPFPLGNWRAPFINGMRAALAASAWSVR
jgi:hypothetical protein